MASPYGKILTGIGLIDGDKLSQSAKDGFIDEVGTLLRTGNANGVGGSATTKIFSALVRLPPSAGPELSVGTEGDSANAFWFPADENADVIIDKLKNEETAWHKNILIGMYEKVAKQLDANGSTPFFPVFDSSIAFPNVKKFPILPPELAVKANQLPPPKLLAKLASLGIEASAPSPPSPPSVAPEIKDYSVPGVEYPGPPPIVIDKFMNDMSNMPFTVLAKLIAQPDISMAVNPTGLPDTVFKKAFEVVTSSLDDSDIVKVVSPLFTASMIIYVKNVVAMICVDIIGMLVGAGGSMTKAMASLTGLV